MKRNTEMDPFTPLNVRAFAQGDVEERSIVLALNFWHWWKGPTKGLGLKGLAILARLPYSTAKKAAARMKGKGWLESQRGYGEKSKYRLTIPFMTHKEAQAIASNWLPQGPMEGDQLALLEPIVGSPRAQHGLPQGPVLSTNKTSQSKTEGHKTSPLRFRGRDLRSKDQPIQGGGRALSIADILRKAMTDGLAPGKENLQ